MLFMPLPLLLVGAAVGVLFAQDKHKDYLEQLDIDRKILSKSTVGREPSEILPSPMVTELIAGTVVCCEVFETFIHTGVVVDNNTIVELHGSGLIRAVSKKRFLEQRSGKNIFIACNRSGTPLNFNLIESLAPKDIFNFYEYELLQSNCYRHTWRWLSGEDVVIVSFSDFNNKLSNKYSEVIFWDVVV